MPPAALRAAAAGRQALTSLSSFVREHWSAESVALMDSGTHALTLAIRVAARCAPAGRAVALPAYCCFDVATAAVATGLPITLYDVSPETLGPDLDSLDAALAAGAGIVVVAPLFGVPIDWDAVRVRADRAGAVLVEDAAQGHGSTWGGRPAGSLAPFSVLSFGRGKGWTGGRGGAFLARDHGARHFDPAADLPPEQSSSAGALARAAALALFSNPLTFALPAAIPWLHVGETLYHDPTPGRALSPAAAGLLLATWPAAQREAETRRERAAIYRAELAATPAIRPVLADRRGQGGYLRFPLLTGHGLRGFASLSQVGRLGITPGYPAPLATLPAVQARLLPDAGAQRWPGAEALANRLVTLPTHSLVRPREIREIVRVVSSYRS
jgi:dTDP-4-amino-4,6-dideoxygalactose transaminase